MYAADGRNSSEPLKEALQKKVKPAARYIQDTCRRDMERWKDPMEVWKLVVFCSNKYAAGARKKRPGVLHKAPQFISDPQNIIGPPH